MRYYEVERWLVIERSVRRYSPSVTMVAKQPKSLPSSKIAVKLHIRLPAALFERSRIEARLVVPDEVVTPAVVTPETLVQVHEAFDAAGLRVELIHGDAVIDGEQPQ